MPSRSDYLNATVEHLDVTQFNAVPLVDGMRSMAFQARNLATACDIFSNMQREKDNRVFLCLAGSLISAGLKKALLTLIENNMVDGIVSTGANMVDMDFFEALGFRHYIGTPQVDDEVLRSLSIDRIYDTYISEHDLRVCDAVVAQVADRLEARPHSSREVLTAMGAYLEEQDLGKESIIRTCYQKQIPIFVPAFSDCSAGFGLALHQRDNAQHVSLDSVRDFTELGKLVMEAESDTGLLLIGGGTPKNFMQDTVVLADILGQPARMHKYAIQITVADERDGALSGSTLKEAHSWGKVEEHTEQMVFCEATIALPILASHAYHSGIWKERAEKRLNAGFPHIALREEQQSSPGKKAADVARRERDEALQSA